MTDISIIVPVYQGENYIRQCLDSILSQTGASFEVICIEDGSSDGTSQILMEYEKDARIRVLYHEKNMGPYLSRREGALCSKGRLIIFLDADNYLLEGALEGMLKAYENKRFDILQFATLVQEEPGITQNMRDGLMGQINAGESFLEGIDILQKCFVEEKYSYHLQTKCFLGDLVRESLGELIDKRLDLAGDWYLYFAIASHAKIYRKCMDTFEVYCFGRGMTGSAYMTLEELYEHTKKSLVAKEIVAYAKKYYSNDNAVKKAADAAYEGLFRSSMCDLRERVSAQNKDKGQEILEEFWGEKRVHRGEISFMKKRGKLDGLRAMKQVYGYLDGAQRFQMFGLFILGLIQALFEFVSIGVLLPYLYVWLEPKKAYDLPGVSLLVRQFPKLMNGSLLAVMTGLLLGIYMVRGVYLVVSNIIQTKAFAYLEKQCSTKLFDAYLNKDYPFYFSHNAAILQRNTNSIASTIFGGMLGAGLSLLRLFLTGIFLVALLIYADIFSAVFAIVCFGLCGLLLFVGLRKNVEQIGYEINENAKEIHKMSLAFFSGVKQLQLFGRQKQSAKSYEILREKQIHLGIRGMLYRIVPAQFMEILTIVIVLVVFMYQKNHHGDVADVLATMSLFGMASIRLKAVVYGVFEQVMGLNRSLVYYDEIGDELEEIFQNITDENKYAQNILSENNNIPNMNKNITEENIFIQVENVSYTYPLSTRQVLHEINFTLKKGQCIGICGESGSGKSTMADLIMGFLQPDSGTVYGMGMNLREKENIEKFRQKIGYVPQEIFLMDLSLAENVAFGVLPENIDRKRVVQVLLMAQLGSYLNSLRDGIDSLVGDGGIRMSGGQRQRIAIARALYHDPEILLFDEATSSLDEATEKELMQTIHALGKEKTMLIISHSQKTLQYCEKVYRMKEDALEMIEK